MNTNHNCRLLFIIIPGVGDHPLCDQREDRPWLRWCRGRWRHHLRSHLWSVLWTHCGKVSSWWSPWLSSLSISESISYHGHHHHHGNHHGYNHHHGNHHGHLCRVLARPDIAKSTLEGTTATSDLFSMVRLYMNGNDDGVSAWWRWWLLSRFAPHSQKVGTCHLMRKKERKKG